MKCREALIARADDFHIILDDIAITHLTFGREYAQAVEMKQVAQQEAERARFVVERAEQEKVANIIRAEGDSKAAELISQSLQQFGTGLIELRKIEVRVEKEKGGGVAGCGGWCRSWAGCKSWAGPGGEAGQGQTRGAVVAFPSRRSSSHLVLLTPPPLRPPHFRRPQKTSPTPCLGLATSPTCQAATTCCSTSKFNCPSSVLRGAGHSPWALSQVYRPVKWPACLPSLWLAINQVSTDARCSALVRPWDVEERKKETRDRGQMTDTPCRWLAATLTLTSHAQHDAYHLQV